MVSISRKNEIEGLRLLHLSAEAQYPTAWVYLAKKSLIKLNFLAAIKQITAYYRCVAH
jgi:hypothetical protein